MRLIIDIDDDTGATVRDFFKLIPSISVFSEDDANSNYREVVNECHALLDELKIPKANAQDKELDPSYKSELGHRLRKLKAYYESYIVMHDKLCQKVQSASGLFISKESLKRIL